MHKYKRLIAVSLIGMLVVVVIAVLRLASRDETMPCQSPAMMASRQPCDLNCDGVCDRRDYDIETRNLGGCFLLQPKENCPS